MRSNKVQSAQTPRSGKGLLRKFTATAISACLLSSGLPAVALASETSDELASEWAEAAEISADPSVDVFSSAGNVALLSDDGTSDASSNFPSSFDLRYDWKDVNGQQHDIVTPVKFQNPWLTCWAFSAVAASETSVWADLYNSIPSEAENTPDFSERAVAWFTYNPVPKDYAGSQVNDKGETEGFHNQTGAVNYAFNACGYMVYAESLFAAGVGPIDEAYAPYKNEQNAILRVRNVAASSGSSSGAATQAVATGSEAPTNDAPSTASNDSAAAASPAASDSASAASPSSPVDASSASSASSPSQSALSPAESSANSKDADSKDDSTDPKAADAKGAPAATKNADTGSVDATVGDDSAAGDPVGDSTNSSIEVSVVNYTAEQIAALSKKERQELKYYVAKLDGNGDEGDDATWSLEGKIWDACSAELKDSNILPSPIITGQDGRWVWINQEGVEAFKSELVQGRPISVVFAADASRPNQKGEGKYIKVNNDGSWAHWSYEDAQQTHAVTIIGWDDNYSRNNFKESNDGNPPEGDGAWIVKNSWGSETEEFPNYNKWGTTDENGLSTGYFYLSYYDRNIALPETFDYDVSSYVYKDPDYIIDQYDLMVSNNRTALPSSAPASMVNVFTASEDQAIRNVSCQTTAPNTEVTYEVYLLDSQSDSSKTRTASSSDADLGLTDPVYTKTETYDYGGYHRSLIDQDQWIAVREGQRYAVKVTEKTVDSAGNATYYQNASNGQRELTEEEKQDTLKQYRQMLEGNMLRQAYQRKYDQLISDGASPEEADQKAVEYANSLPNTPEFQAELKNGLDAVEKSLDNYLVAVVNEGESFAGRADESGDMQWTDWSVIAKSLNEASPKQLTVFDNLPIKAIANTADYADEDSLNQLSNLLKQAEAALKSYKISKDGTDISPNEKWVTQEQYDAMAGAIEKAAAILEGAGPDFSKALLTTPAQSVVNDALTELDGAYGTYNEQARQGTKSGADPATTPGADDNSKGASSTTSTTFTSTGDGLSPVALIVGIIFGSGLAVVMLFNIWRRRP